MPQPIFEPITPELNKLQAAVNKDLYGIARVNLFVRVVGDRREWCVGISNGSRRSTRESNVPLSIDDKDEIVKVARNWALAPRPVHSRYGPLEDLQADTAEQIARAWEEG